MRFSRCACLFLSMVFVASGNLTCLAQSGALFAGYKGLKWGASLSQVSAQFPGLDSLGISEDRILHIYMQKNPIEGVDNRLFYFWNDQMVRVRLFYDHQFVTDIGVESFVNRMINSFGKPTSQRLRRGVHLNENETWDIVEASWGDDNTTISFQSREQLSPRSSWVCQLEFQSVRLLKEITEGGGIPEPERDWGW